MLRTHTCGDLNISHLGQSVTLCGWVQKSRDLGGTTFIDVRDRYGLTQLVFNTDTDASLREISRELGREFVIKVTGTVVERSNKNLKIATGEVEISVKEIEILNAAKIPPFLIEDDTDGGEELRAKYRYLDLRRAPIRNNMILRHKMAQEVRKYLDGLNFIEVETPVLIKSTPEGARDFVVPSRMNAGEFYALPQSPQTFKQLLMVSGFDRYFQIVKCFRDEDLRADRQPEFTQIDCEMSFITQEDILNTFEGLAKRLFKSTKNLTLNKFPRMQYADAMRYYGSDKPDLRFGMKFVELNDLVKNKGFGLFDNAELIIGINAKGCANYTRKQIDELTEYVKRPQVGATGLIYCRHNEDQTLKSSVDKFFDIHELQKWSRAFESEVGDLMLIMAGSTNKVRKQLSDLRLRLKFCTLLQSQHCVNSVFKKNNSYLPKLKLDDFDGSYISLAFSLKRDDLTKFYFEKVLKKIEPLGFLKHPTRNFNQEIKPRLLDKEEFKETCKYLTDTYNINFSIFNNPEFGAPWSYNNDNLVPTEQFDIANKINAGQEDLVFLFSGQISEVFACIKAFRKIFTNSYSIKSQLNRFYNKYLKEIKDFAPLWVLDFPLLEWDEETERYHAMHHPFTSPKPEDIALLETDPGAVRANAYDMVINGIEVGGGSIRIHDRELQALMFKHLGFSQEEAQKQFGFLMDAFEFGAPPHGGIAFGFDRLCSIFAGLDSIRDVIAFPKNNSGRDVMIDSPSTIADAQLNELKIRTTV